MTNNLTGLDILVSLAFLFHSDNIQQAYICLRRLANIKKEKNTESAISEYLLFKTRRTKN